MREARTLSREIQVTAIPYGERILLPAGVTVFVTQALGGSYTAMTDRGYMVRVESRDADAIGESPSAPPTPEAVAGRPVVDRCWDQLKTCYDPEIPVNIVDLGLVYSCEVTGEEGQHKVSVRFTLTAPGCGMGDYLKYDIEEKLNSVPGVAETDVQIAFEPAWNQSMMTEAARLQLGLM